MREQKTVLPPGYSDLAPGDIATLVTHLEMREKPSAVPVPLPAGITIRALKSLTPAIYRELYSKVGAEWLWSSRLLMPDTELAAILNHQHTEIYALCNEGEDIGLLELDFSQPDECELVYFGLVSQATGKGLGKALMSEAVERAWSRPIKRFWVHTCTFDSPGALRFYRTSGFTPYAFQVEVQADPRLTGILPMDVAPHVPVIPPARSSRL